MAAHHGTDRGRVGRAAGGRGEDIRQLVEIGRSEHPGCRDREEPHILLATIVESVDLSAADAHRLAGPTLTSLAVDRPCAGTVEHIGSLLEAVVAVSRGHPGAGWDEAFEHRDAAVGILGFDQEVDSQRTELNRCLRG